MQGPETIAGPVLSWSRSDPEQRLAFRGARFTNVNPYFSVLLGSLLTIVFYFALVPFQATYFGAMFTQRGVIPYCIAAFFFWSIAILVTKYFKLCLQRKSLQIEIVPDDPEFVLSPTTVREVYGRIVRSVDDPKHFILFNRITIALSNLKNLGRVADVDDIMRSQAENDEKSMETSYSLLHGLVWAIPVLGFIGTVVGLSGAVGGFGEVLSSTTDLSQVKDALRGVTGGLAIAFETTLEGLVAALFIQLMLTQLKKSEEDFHDACSEYCVTHIVGRLRLVPFETVEER